MRDARRFSLWAKRRPICQRAAVLSRPDFADVMPVHVITHATIYTRVRINSRNEISRSRAHRRTEKPVRHSGGGNLSRTRPQRTFQHTGKMSGVKRNSFPEKSIGAHRFFHGLSTFPVTIMLGIARAHELSL